MSSKTLTSPLSPGRSARFEEFDRRAVAGEPLSVVFFGGSLTWGAYASDPQRTSYRALMGDYLRNKYPRSQIVCHDAAIGGTGSTLGIFRLERDVLSRTPDLVFLDFTVNDGIEQDSLNRLDSYESILRELIGRGIPVVQVFLGFKCHFGPNYHPERLPRLMAHRKLAAAYGTGTADVFPFIQERILDGSASPDVLWLDDVIHPDDAGYELFFGAVRDGFEQAILERRICTMPEKPVFGDTYRNRQRIRLADRPIPAGWKKATTYRTSLWFDALSSRWMDDVLMCGVSDSAAVEPLQLEFSGTFVGIFGEADQDALGFTVTLDGQPLLCRDNPKAEPMREWAFDTKRFEGGRHFMWRVLSESLPPGQHTLFLHPLIPAKASAGQLRIESICVAG